MITSILILLLIIFLIINIFSVILIKIQIEKLKIYETWILGFQQKVTISLEKLKEIDKRGTFASSMNNEGLFESDDEVGYIFKDMIKIIEELNDKIK